MLDLIVLNGANRWSLQLEASVRFGGFEDRDPARQYTYHSALNALVLWAPGASSSVGAGWLRRKCFGMMRRLVDG